MKHIDKRHGALVNRFVELFVDEIIGEVDVAGVFFGVAVINAFQMGPVAGTEAHGAGLARSIDDAIGKVKGTQLLAGLPNGVDFGVGSGIVVNSDAVGTAGHDLAVLYDDSTERPSTVAHALVGQTDGLTQEFLILCYDSHGQKIKANNT